MKSLIAVLAVSFVVFCLFLTLVAACRDLGAEQGEEDDKRFDDNPYPDNPCSEWWP